MSLIGLQLARSLAKRKPLLAQAATQAFRAFSGDADGIDGVYVDVYASGATMNVYEGRAPRGFDAIAEAHAALEAMKPAGVTAVYVKPFARDRSRLGGELPDGVTNPQPAAGEPLPETIIIREHRWNLEVRLYDGLSTGLFLDQRDNRNWVSDWVRRRKQPTSVLNTFAYTCAFSVAAAVSGAATASVDVSGRYLDWGKRNFEHNTLDPSKHRFAKMDTFEFLGYASRKGLKYDLIILDPPSFGSGSKKKGIKPWSAESGYARLVSEASKLLNRNGVIFASTNTQELCKPGRLEKQIIKGLGRTPKWMELPPVPLDFADEQDRFAAMAFSV